MSHSRTKPPLDVLQGMINLILIETGRAIRSADKEGGKTMANARPRLRSTIPGAIENFHQALDDIEADIIRAKAVFLRDLEALRSERIVAENPVVEPPEEVTVKVADSPMLGLEESIPPKPEPATMEEKPALAAEILPEPPTQPDQTNDIQLKRPEPPEGLQGLSPPSSNEDKPKAKHTGLGIETAPNTATTDSQQINSAAAASSMDSLFDMPESGTNAEPNLDFDGMDFLNDDTGATDTLQPQSNDFDMNSFGNDAQDFSMTNLNTSAEAGNTNNTDVDDLFGMSTNTASGDMMDLDASMRPVEESAFDDMFFMGENDNTAGDGGDFDDAFFGLTTET